MKTNKCAKLYNRIRSLYLVSAILLTISCKKALDVVPDNVATIDHAFANTIEAEKYLFTCYNYLPNSGTSEGNIGLLAGDELWIPDYRQYFQAATWSVIARGQQNSGEPAANYWDGMHEGKDLFEALRHCNIFLENVSNPDKVRDLRVDLRARWIAEVTFLKAYYHYFLLRMYGPIPLIDKNIPISAPPEEVRVKRRPIDECVSYISSLLDQSYADLPLVINNKNDELGRITKPINRAVKAKLLLLAASPLFNGNPDYASFTNKDGEPLFSAAFSAAKWQAAADATKTAIDEAEAAGNKLYYYKIPEFEMTDTTMIQMSIRGAVTERWNDEVVWGLSNSRANTLQRAAQPLLHADMGVNSAYASLAPTLKVVQQFYSDHGVPIEEDKTKDFSQISQLRIATNGERVNFETRYETARLNFDRENRFYASIGFDGGKWLTSDLPARKDYEAYTVKAKMGQISAGSAFGLFSETGYYAKKLVNWESRFAANASIWEYPWPEIRLADLYLMYAEALNETSGPVSDVHKYLDLIRQRAGLESVTDSWQKYSKNPAKPTTKDGMRAIIRRERLIELAFEGSRFWDLRRWKESARELNGPVRGWDVSQKDAIPYYQVRTIFQQRFIAPRDYLWPIRLDEMTVNDNLVQNPGW
ncbi:RagB/SusD family nutrient uptake outer membrane protein [Sphingobacterium puteale]|uniref:RagB/SusD family nutrient uptake outer membrane protein n=1 Tax=Sphingobacterium puteale TaxID=2420510 RepID=UPI003D998CFC